MKPIFRLVKRADVKGILDIYAPFIENTTVSFELKVPSEDEFWARIQKVIDKSPWLVCEINGVIAGYAYASDHRSRGAYQWNREVSVYVHEQYHKRGIASNLYKTLLHIIKRQGFCNALAGVTLPNPPSEAFHKNFGFRLVGIYHNIGYKYGQWRDVAWWELQLNNDPPEKLLSLTEVMQHEDTIRTLQEGASKVKHSP